MGRETSNHDVDSKLVALLIVGGGGDGTAAGLQNKSDNVGNDKDDGNPLGLEQAEPDAEDGDDPAEADVDGGCDKGRGDGGADEVGDKVVPAKDVIVQHDPPRIAHNLENHAADHADEESPGLVADAQEALGDEQGGEDGEVDGVAGERGDVGDSTKLFYGAGFECAQFSVEGWV